MSVTTTNDLQTLARGVSGVDSAPALASYPTNLGATARAAAEIGFPLVLTFPSDGEHTKFTPQGGMGIRTYQALVLFADATKEQAFSAAQMVAFVTLLHALGRAYVTAGTLGGGASVMKGSGDITDSGLVIVNYAGLDCYGTEFRIRVREA